MVTRAGLCGTKSSVRRVRELYNRKRMIESGEDVALYSKAAWQRAWTPENARRDWGFALACIQPVGVLIVLKIGEAREGHTRAAVGNRKCSFVLAACARGIRVQAVVWRCYEDLRHPDYRHAVCRTGVGPGSSCAGAGIQSGSGNPLRMGRCIARGSGVRRNHANSAARGMLR